MLGDIEHLGDRPSENRGMTPRVFEYLFSRIKLVRRVGLLLCEELGGRWHEECWGHRRMRWA
jgi:hypothetical protein